MCGHLLLEMKGVWMYAGCLCSLYFSLGTEQLADMLIRFLADPYRRDGLSQLWKESCVVDFPRYSSETKNTGQSWGKG